MIVLGNKYKFTELEEKRLNKKFKNRIIIKYANKDIQDVLSEINSHLKRNQIELIVLNTRAKVPNQLIKFLTNLQLEGKIKITTIERFLEDYLNKCYIPEDHKDLHFLEDIKPFTNFQYFQKRCIDITSVTILFLLSWPFMIICKNKIKSQSPGSVFFYQNRVGKNKKKFKCIKFRTMHENSHHDPYTRKNDSRVFPFGATMRRTRLDELPQLLNILKGEMHLIGPRAEWDILVKKYENEIPYYQERHLNRPGLTGWAQVNYPYGVNIEDTKQKLMYDLYYIKNWNLLLELKITWKTILTVLGQKGL